MNAQLQRQPSELDDSIPRSSARPATDAPVVQLSSPAAEDRPTPPGNDRRVNPLWMITAAGALMFAFLLAAMSSI
ncbi:hypothetical protein [Steroidobacter cummioxidans]|uniref:hypothetical protein n=1 Tax=Steroidobacter cummioxidans TaxID=1803913 RepID=UPI0012907C72|nr:hypothetical protein [Steroidobacter cummioxidans]